jgi:hypothetical protein
MADIVLAQIGERTWMVGGEPFLDALLANMLPNDVTIEFVTCQSESEVQALWYASLGNPDEFEPPWLIHPAIVSRTKRMIAQSVAESSGLFEVPFAAWSAARNEAADETIGAAVEMALEDPSLAIVITSYVAADAPAFASDLAKIRMGMVEAELTARGIDKERLAMASAVAEGDHAEKGDTIEIAIGEV